MFSLANNYYMDLHNIEDLWIHLRWLTMQKEQALIRPRPDSASARLRAGACSRHSLVQRTTRSVQLMEAGQHLIDSTRGQYAPIAVSFA